MPARRDVEEEKEAEDETEVVPGRSEIPPQPPLPLPMPAEEESPIVRGPLPLPTPEEDNASRNLFFSMDQSPAMADARFLKSGLRSYQRQGLHWMMARENGLPIAPGSTREYWTHEVGPDGTARYINELSRVEQEGTPTLMRGGILADDMGIGKTIQMIALIATNSGKKWGADGWVGRADGPTLIVCPLSVIGNWKKQIKDHTLSSKENGVSMSVHVYHGTGKDVLVETLRSTDVVITTYGTMTRECSFPGRIPGARPRLKRPTSPLFATTWLRVVLDEAHVIRNSRADQALAAYDLKAARRWCVTGTPFQNDVSDLFSLVKFLQFSELQERAWWDAFITNADKRTMGMCYLRVLEIQDVISLRRSKDVLDLKPVLSIVDDVVLSEEERRLYQILHTRMMHTYKNLVKGQVPGTKNALEAMVRLRQFVNHPQLVPAECFEPFARTPGADLRAIIRTQSVFGPEDEEEEEEEEAEDDEVVSGTVTEISEGEHVVERTTHPWPVATPSAKMRAILARLKDALADPEAKVVLFSQWTGMLDLIVDSLQAMETVVPFIRLDGSTPAASRERLINEFQESVENRNRRFLASGADDHGAPRVFLISLKAGGVGLNLTAANYVFLVDPWWNPAMEDQAIDRVNRSGQTRQVTVVRFVVKDTVEDGMQTLQDCKRGMVLNATPVGDVSVEVRVSALIEKLRIILKL